MLNDLIDFLRDKYHPVKAIILHGSRASGYAREHSDWDFIVLVDYEFNQKEFRANVNGQEIEFEVYQLPILTKTSVRSLFGTKLKHAKIILDTNDVAKNIITIAQAYYIKGISDTFITGAGLLSRKSTMNSALNGMIDSIDDPAMFVKKLSAFYPRIINMWYWFKEKSFSDNLYISIPYIKEKDPDFFRELEKVYSFDTRPHEKILASEKLFKMIFG